MLDYTRGLPRLSRLESQQDLDLKGTSLVDLIGWMLADECERLLRDGLLQDYVTREETLPVLRGRLLVAQQVRRHMGRVDRLDCSFDELESDVLENRLLAAGLAADTGLRLGRDPDVLLRLRRAHAVFLEACDPRQLDLEAARVALDYHRRDEHYREAHQLAWLLLRGQALDDLFIRGSGRTQAFLIDMNRLFEDFVTRLLEEELALRGVSVHRQARDHNLVLDGSTGRGYSAIIPDVLLETGKTSIPLDIKYKLYDKRKLESGDIYQTFFYAYAGGSESGGARNGLLVYPSTQHVEPHHLVVRNANVHLWAIGLDVVKELARMRNGSASGCAPLIALVLELLKSG